MSTHWRGGEEEGGGASCATAVHCSSPLDKFLEKAHSKNRVPRTTAAFETAASIATDEAEKVDESKWVVGGTWTWWVVRGRGGWYVDVVGGAWTWWVVHGRGGWCMDMVGGVRGHGGWYVDMVGGT